MRAAQLILFCGGPAIYDHGVPKPLRSLGGAGALIGVYLRQDFVQSFESVVIVCETSFVKEFRAVVDALEARSQVHLVESPDGSSTLQKLSLAMASSPGGSALVVASYPDIFCFGQDWSQLDHRLDLGHIAITAQPLESRFPRIMLDPYTHRAKSISHHRARVPANPVFMFGGHLIARRQDLAVALEDFLRDNGEGTPSLEFDMLAWLISEAKVNSLVLECTWLQLDSARDELKLLALLGDATVGV